ncbi:MAG: DUF3604 domain-containing protein [Gammaproteobacteria bacterium]|nr:DUF3604 domain-containing protein [Gammaproteobacteria bacterium]
MNPEMIAEYSPGGKTYASIWERVVDAAERFNDPGEFTAFIGFEMHSASPRPWNCSKKLR